MIPLPKDFTDRMRKQLGEEYPDFLRALEGNPIRGIRLNPMKTFPEKEVYQSAERIPWEKNGYLLAAESPAGSTVFHEAGGFYLQEPAAMLPGALLDAKPGERILDLCAAPGGKSTQIGAGMKGTGLLVSNDPVLKRAQILSRNIERIGIPNALVTCARPEQLASRWKNVFDKILVDAPCSGEGMFRRSPESRLEWSTEQAAGCVKRQWEILNEAAKMVRPGGRIVYSTCTYNPEENEKLVLRFLDMHNEFEPDCFPIPGEANERFYYTCYPHQVCGEGQFAARIRKKDDEFDRAALQGAGMKPDREMIRAAGELLPEGPEANYLIRNTLTHVPEIPEIRGICVIRAGLHLAEIKGRNLIPDHAAAMSFLSCGGPVIDLDATDTVRYISGEEIAHEIKGWTRIRYHGLILGWGKGSDGRIRNHYPKGLRKDHILTDA